VPSKIYQPTELREIEKILSSFSPVTLAEIEEVKLMSRIDRKYWFHISKLAAFLELTLPFYEILEINGLRLMEYQTRYFDSPENLMYLEHHNRQLPRFKIRERLYASTDDGFLEIKHKTNKKITNKSRIGHDFENGHLVASEIEFISSKIPFDGRKLQPTLHNKFKRITLIHKERLDRCTIDISPVFWNKEGEIKLENLIIFELKRGNHLKSSPMISIVRSLKIRQRGMSKYCSGRALLEPALKQNAFKSNLRFIRKHLLNK